MGSLSQSSFEVDSTWEMLTNTIFFSDFYIQVSQKILGLAICYLHRINNIIKVSTKLFVSNNSYVIFLIQEQDLERNRKYSKLLHFMRYLFRENNYLIFSCAIADCHWTIQRNILLLLCGPSNFAFHTNNGWLLSTVRLNKSSFLLTSSGILTCQRQPSFIFWKHKSLVDSWVFLTWVVSEYHHHWLCFAMIIVITSSFS